MKYLIMFFFVAFFYNSAKAQKTQDTYDFYLKKGKVQLDSGHYDKALANFEAAQISPNANAKEVKKWINKATLAKNRAKNNERVRANNSSKAGAEIPTDIAAELNFSFGSDIQKVIEKRIDIDRFFDSIELAKFEKPHIKPANLGALEYLNIQFNRIPVSIKKYDSSKTDIFKGLTTSYTIVTPHDGEVILLDPSYQKINSIINNLRDGDKIVIKNIDAKTVNISFTDNSAADLATAAEAVIRNMVFEFTVEKDSDKELAKKQEAKRIQDEKENATNEEEKKKHALIEQQLFNETGFEMKFIPGGTFNMGSNSSYNTMPVHKVTLDSFYMCKYETTTAQWFKFMGENPTFSTCGNCAVFYVSWNDVQIFIKKLNKKTGKKFRLPTEAEWEYAARAGENYDYAGSNIISEVADTSYGEKKIGRKIPNNYGLYDMTGNIGEWCSDYYDEHYFSISPPVNPENKTKNYKWRVSRGNFYYTHPESSKVYSRGLNKENEKSSFVGFRLVLTQ